MPKDRADAISVAAQALAEYVTSTPAAAEVAETISLSAAAEAVIDALTAAGYMKSHPKKPTALERRRATR